MLASDGSKDQGFGSLRRTPSRGTFGFRFRVQWLREFLHFARFCNIPSLLGAFWVPAGVPARVTGVWLGGRGLGFRVQGFEFSA